MKTSTVVRWLADGSSMLLTAFLFSSITRSENERHERVHGHGVPVWNFVDFWPTKGATVPTNSHYFIVCRGCREEFLDALDSGSPLMVATNEKISLIKLRTYRNMGQEQVEKPPEGRITVIEYMTGWDMRGNTHYQLDFKNWNQVLKERAGQLTYDVVTGEKPDHEPPKVIKTHDFGIKELEPGEECPSGGIKGLLQVTSKDDNDVAVVVNVKKDKGGFYQRVLLDGSTFVNILECTRAAKHGLDLSEKMELTVDLIDVAGNFARNVVGTKDIAREKTASDERAKATIEKLLEKQYQKKK